MRNLLLGALLLWLFIPVAGQTPAASATPNSKTETELAELQGQAVTLLEETARELREMRASENRVRWQAQLASLLWPREEKQARAVFEEALAGWKAVLRQRAAKEDTPDADFHNLASLRVELTRAVSGYDAALALRFVRSTRSLMEPYLQERAGEKPEVQLETDIAAQAVRSDPQLALKIAQETLAQGVTGAHIQVLQGLQKIDRAAAQGLARQIYNGLNESDLLQPAAGYAGYTLAHFAHHELRNAPPMFSENEVRRMVERLVAAALSVAPSAGPYAPETSQARGLLNYLSNFPDLDKYAPGRKAEIQNRLAAFNQTPQSNNDPWRQYGDIINQKSLPEALQQLANAPAQYREGLYQQLAGKTAQSGNFEQARQIINENVRSPQNRNQALRNLEQQIFGYHLSKGQIAEARAVLASTSAKHDRLRMSFALAGYLTSKDKKDEALQLLDEISQQIALHPADQEQLNDYFNLLQAYQRVAPQKVFPLLDPVVEQFNEMCVAAEKLNGFAGKFFREGEFLAQGHSLSVFTQRFAQIIPALAMGDFEQAKRTVAKAQRPEVRVLLNLAISQRILNGEPRRGGRGAAPQPPRPVPVLTPAIRRP